MPPHSHNEESCSSYGTIFGSWLQNKDLLCASTSVVDPCTATTPMTNSHSRSSGNPIVNHSRRTHNHQHQHLYQNNNNNGSNGASNGSNHGHYSINGSHSSSSNNSNNNKELSKYEKALEKAFSKLNEEHQNYHHHHHQSHMLQHQHQHQHHQQPIKPLLSRNQQQRNNKIRRYNVKFYPEVEIYTIPNISDMTRREIASMYLSREEMTNIHREAWKMVDLMNLGIEYEDVDEDPEDDNSSSSGGSGGSASSGGSRRDENSNPNNVKGGSYGADEQHYHQRRKKATAGRGGSGKGGFSKRGLVDLKDTSVERRRRMRENAYKVVFGVQAFHNGRQPLENMDGDAILADLYHKAATPAREEAYRVGKMDALEAGYRY